MDLGRDSPVEDFPGLYTAEGSKDESDFSEDHDKVSKKELLIGRKKDKKDKSKDRGYAALAALESEEEFDSKSPLKSKKSKTFKFTSSKSKEKREKSRDKEKLEKETRDDDHNISRDKEKPDKECKKKDKERKEKDKKDKFKEKDKKEKKAKQPSSGISEEVLELGDVQPVFGVSIGLATERSRCHDGVDLPLVIRDCIDFLQEQGLKSEQIYKVDPLKTRLQYFKRLYNNRERQPDADELDVPTACGLLKLFLRELPEPVLTTDLIARFEEVASHPQVTRQQEELEQLLEQLPSSNRTLLAWILLHFDAVIQQERHNKTNAQSLAMLLSPPLQMSHRLLVALLCHCPSLFAETQLIKYVPPLTASSPKLPETPKEIQLELCKQESLLAQIHAEMNAGFVSKKREEQLWEVQRIITQLKRKLRSFEKRQEKSFEEQSTTTRDDVDAKTTRVLNQTKLNSSDDEANKTACNAVYPIETPAVRTNENILPMQNETIEQRDVTDIHVNDDQKPADNVRWVVDEVTGFLMLPKTHPDYVTLLRLQLENEELLAWKTELQARIGIERAETLRLKHLHQQQVNAALTNANARKIAAAVVEEHPDYEQLIEHYMRENSLLEQKKNIMAKEIFEERQECVALKVELTMRKF